MTAAHDVDRVEAGATSPLTRLKPALLAGVTAGVLVAVVMAVRGGASTAGACRETRQVSQPWVLAVDGIVNTLAARCGVVYVGGSFDQIGMRTGGFVSLDRNGLPAGRAPQVLGEVFAVEADGREGWFVGGAFTHVNGMPCPHLAHIRRDGSHDRRWCPNPNGDVLALARAGGSLVVGGTFTEVAGVRRAKLAILSASRPIALRWDAPVGGRPIRDRDELVPRNVNALAVHGRSLYVGGFFERVSGVRRANAAAIDVTTGAVLPWNPKLIPRSDFSGLSALSVSGDAVYLAGGFRAVAGARRDGLAAVSLDGRLLPWRPQAILVSTIEAGPSAVYLGGRFNRVGNARRNGLAAVDTAHGDVLGWSPRLGPRTNGDFTVTSISAANDRIYAAGQSASERVYSGAWDPASGKRVSWSPRPNSAIRVIAVSENHVAIGGGFTSVVTTPRSSLAAVDAATGHVLPWAPRITGTSDDLVGALLIDDNTLWIGGNFNQIDGQKRDGLAAFDLTRRNLRNWRAPAVTGGGSEIHALSVSGNRLYVGGWFLAVGGKRRIGLAALSRSGGELLDWHADIGGLYSEDEGDVRDLVVDEDRVWVAGNFNTLAGAPRHGVGAVNIETGAPLAWDARLDQKLLGSNVSALAVRVKALLVGGDFSTIAGVTREAFAALDTRTARAFGRPRVDGFSVNDIALTPTRLFIIGRFHHVDGRLRPNIAALDPTTLRLLSWVPSPQQAIQHGTQVVASEDFVFTASNFDEIAAHRLPRLNGP